MAERTDSCDIIEPLNWQHQANKKGQREFRIGPFFTFHFMWLLFTRYFTKSYASFAAVP